MITAACLVVGSLAEVYGIRAVVTAHASDGRYRVRAFAGGPEFEVDAIDCWALTGSYNRSLVRGLARGTGRHGVGQ